MEIRILIEYDKETQSYAAYCPEISGCTSCGDSEQEALENMKQAIALFFEPVDIPLENKSVYSLAV